jgi:acetylornithine deacetylase/succinyl-diaminopimelate desuccinylase-like protein
MDSKAAQSFIDARWDESAVPELIEYIKIPNKSPQFDPDWEAHGYMEQVVQQFTTWCEKQSIDGMQLEVVRLPGRTPLIFMDIPGAGEKTVLLYGHLDKQPEMSGWRDGLGPWQPVLEGDRLYGRGGADDGYATFASLIAIKALQEQGIPHARCVVIIEACEESGSYDLPHYIEALADRIGDPELVICLDSGCGNYDQLWCTTSLRGTIGGVLEVQVLNEGVHSGDASGIVASSFRILRQLLERVEMAADGVISAPEFNVAIPDSRLEQARRAAEVLGVQVYTRFPFVNGMRPANKNPTELILNRTWRPTLSVIGADGLPALADAGNVLRPRSAVKLSLRLPPTCDADTATRKLQSLLEGHAPELAPWLEQALDQASRHYFGQPAMYMGEGGTIPFMGMLSKQFPGAQFLITGVLGPQANAHGPNEFLHIPTARKLTACVAEVLASHFEKS